MRMGASLSYETYVEEIALGSFGGVVRLGRFSVGLGGVYLNGGDMIEVVPDPVFGGNRGIATEAHVLRLGNRCTPEPGDADRRAAARWRIGRHGFVVTGRCITQRAGVRCGRAVRFLARHSGRLIAQHWRQNVRR